MIAQPIPNHWPTISDFIAEHDAGAVLYWNRVCAEMDKRGNLETYYRDAIEILSVTCSARDKVRVGLSKSAPEARAVYEEAMAEFPDRISDLLDLLLLPPNFADESQHF